MSQAGAPEAVLYGHLPSRHIGNEGWNEIGADALGAFRVAENRSFLEAFQTTQTDSDEHPHLLFYGISQLKTGVLECHVGRSQRKRNETRYFL